MSRLSFSAQVYKWALAIYCRGVTLQWTSIPSREGGGIAIFSITSCHRNCRKALAMPASCVLCVLLYLTLPYLILPYLTLPYLTLPYLALPCLALLTLPYLTVPYLTLPYLTLPCLALPRKATTWARWSVYVYIIFSYYISMICETQ